MGDIQEMSFQNVVDTILKPQGINVGGFPDELFLDLSEKERERWQCNICYLVMRDPQQCDNNHKFCATCVFAWSMTYGANSDKCPVCRCKQHEYARDRRTDTELSMKWVKCPEKGCALRCPLRDFLQHSHGMKLYATSSDLNSLRRERPAPVNPMGNSGIVFLPTLGRGDNGGSVREGRNLLQDMMLVLHLEMELRRRAIDRFSSENNDAERARHMSEVLAIQEQMQEITGFLNILFSIPPTQQAARRRLGMNSFPGGANDDSSDSDSSESSDSSGVVSRYRLAERQRQQDRNSTLASGNRPTLNRAQQERNTVQTPAAGRSVRRSEIQQELRRFNNEQSEIRGTLDRINNDHVQTLAAASQTTAAAQRAAGVAYASSSLAAQRSGTVTGEDPGVFQPPLPTAQVRRSNENTIPDIGTRTVGNRNRLTSVRQAEAESQPPDSEGAASGAAAASGAVAASGAAAASGAMPRSSTTFQSAMEQLPPISRQNSLVQDSGGDDSEDVSHTRTTTRLSTSVLDQPGVAPTPHRRPAPPAGPGPILNTTRPRRRSTTTNPQTGNNTSTLRQTTNNAAQRQNSNTPTSRQTTNSLQRRPAANRNHNRVRSDSTVPLNTNGGLPTTSGALLRARRRSEIQQQITRNISNNEETENS